jgi:hypothetical protein
MPLEYDHKTAEAWPEGNYPAVLSYVKDGKSKKGNPMQEWTFDVYDDANDRKQQITEYVTAQAAFKIKQLAAALGQTVAFQRDQFQADNWIDSQLTVALSIETNEEFGDKNRIQRISARAGVPVKPVQAAQSRRPSAMERMMDAPVQTVPADDNQQITDADIPF